MLVRRNMDDLMEMDLPSGGIAAVHVCACNPRKLSHYPAYWIPANCAHTVVLHPTAPPPLPVDDPNPYGQLNSGTVVLEPSQEVADGLVRFLETDKRVATFSFPDQDLLTAFFHGKWTALPWYYNALRTLRNIHAPLWDDDVVRCVHYILAEKPWQARTSTDFDVVNGWWWNQFEKMSAELQVEDVNGWKLVSTLVAQ
ncbi:nucleotide-diphospho-sugar transferase [Mycena sp. CBHHK59/15]|nr:nucleotide-diphospho-sugar transferase [Mycena sp. CBHHK59/15]